MLSTTLATEQLIDEVTEKHDKIEAMLDVTNWGLLTQTEHELLERKIADYVNFTKEHLIKLKTHQNMLVTINKLPVELFTRIIFFAEYPKYRRHHFIHYTWVCHYWRFVIIQNRDFWTFISFRVKESINPFYYELLERSKSAGLNAEISIGFFDQDLEPEITNLITEAGERIDRLWLSLYDNSLIHSLFSHQPLPNLRALAYFGEDFDSLIPILETSDRLQILQCTLSHHFRLSDVHLLKPLLCRLRCISIKIYLLEDLKSVLPILPCIENLEELRIVLSESKDVIKLPPGQIITLREVEYLDVNSSDVLEHFQAPKLSALDTVCESLLLFLKYPIFEEFDFSSRHSILGTSKPIHSERLFSMKTEGFAEDMILLEDAEKIFRLEDFTLHGPERDFFHIKFSPRDLAWTVEGALSLVLPRLTNLTELYLVSYALCRTTKYDEILTWIPNVEKLVIQYGSALQDLIRLLSNPSLCPKLKHFHFTLFRPNPQSHENLKRFSEVIGRELIDCLRSRQKVLGNKLKFIALGYCPPLPYACIQELKNFDTIVVTAKDFKSLMSVKRSGF